MNGGFVADSSVEVAWAALSQSSPSCDQLLTEVSAGRPFVVPGLWMIEVGNALLVLRRRKRITPGQYKRARRAVGLLAPSLDEEGPRLALGRISDLAEQYGLSLYEAVYLEVALRRGLPLASRDASLNKAAGRCGVEVLL